MLVLRRSPHLHDARGFQRFQLKQWRDGGTCVVCDDATCVYQLHTAAVRYDSNDTSIRLILARAPLYGAPMQKRVEVMIAPMIMLGGVESL